MHHDAPSRKIIIGIDTHKDTHAAVALNALGVRLGATIVPVNRVGYRCIRDRFLRTVARCFLDDGSDLMARMVSSGWTWASTKYSMDYVPQEREAEALGLGIHGRGCRPSWEWRRAQR